MFADHTSLVSRETDPSAIPNQISNDLHSNTWFYHWEVNFNPDTGKQGQEVIFSLKIKVTAHPQLSFNNNVVHESSTQKVSWSASRFQAKFT